MFKTLLLATVAGGVAANAPPSAPELAARANTPPSYLCNSVNKKCNGAKAQSSVTAYCSSYLKIPKVTSTKKITTCTTTTTKQTSFTATVTKPASVATTTLSCAAPTQTEVEEGGSTDEPADDEQPQKREPEAPRGYRAVPKPSCLSSHKKATDVSAACKCASIKPKTTTVKTTITTTKTETQLVKASLLWTSSTRVYALIHCRLQPQSLVPLQPPQ